jgi:UTP--glucose-1-phosphate uridylyltransferase
MKRFFLILLCSCAMLFCKNREPLEPMYDHKGVDMRITKVVIPAAGYGTRFLPITKSIPKEMLPLFNKPALQNVIEESVASHVTDISLIVSKEKTAIRDYFTRDPEFEAMLKSVGKLNRLGDLPALIDQCNFSFINQPEMLGLADAISMAESTIHNEYFGVILPDMVVFDDQPCLKGLIEAAQKYEAIIIGVMEVPAEEMAAYGCIELGAQVADNLIEITDIIEKPKPGQAFSNLAIMGRYVFPPEIFNAFRSVPPLRGEIMLTDAIAYLAKQGHKVLAYKISGTCYDLGRPHGWLEANLRIGLESTEYGDYLRRAIAKLL